MKKNPSPRRGRQQRLALGLAALLTIGSVGTFVLGRRETSLPHAGKYAGVPIVLITIDTLRADRLGVYGSNRNLTPHLDALARHGVRFDAAVAQAPLTLPSHATILTGLYPTRHGARTNDGFRVDAAVPTIAERLRESAYATAAFIAAYPLRRETGIARGFELYDDEFLRDVQGGGPRAERRAGAVVDATLRWLATETRSGEPRLFVWLHLFDPHTPYAPPAEMAAAFIDTPYDGEVAYTDAEIGRFFDGLRSLGLYENAIIIVVADHGESLGEHGERTHGMFVYDATIRVPLIVRLPRDDAAGRVVSAPVATADIAPTLAALTGTSLPETDGMSLVNLMAGVEGEPERGVYVESYYQNVLLGWSPLRGIRTARWKFIEAPRPELYDLESDPSELANIIGTRAHQARSLASLLPAAEPAPAIAAGSGESAERLRSLGYVSGRTVAAAASIDPKDGVHLWSLLEAGIEATDHDAAQAEAAFLEVLTLDPQNGLAWKYLGDVSFRTDRNTEAGHRYRRAIDAGFEHPDVFVNLTEIALRLERPGEARWAAERAVELEPDSAASWNRLGILRADAGDLEAARAAFERALTLDSVRAEPYYNLALLDLRQGRQAEAEAKLQQALLRRPSYAEASLEIGNIRTAAGQLPEALDAYQRALDIYPRFPEALFAAARTAAAMNRHQDARELYERFLDTAPPAYRRHIDIARREVDRLRSVARAP